MQFVKELGCGATKRGMLYEHEGKKIVILEAVCKSKKRSFLWQSRREANITQNLPSLCCDIRTVRVRRIQGKWQVSAHYVEGEPLTPEWFCTLSEEKQTKLLADLAEFLISLHSLRITKLDERYADETDHAGVLYLLGAFFYKCFCFKKHYLSLQKPWKNPFKSSKFEREKRAIFRRYDFAPHEKAQVEKVLDSISAHPELFSYMGVCFGDFFSSNILYNPQTSQLGVLDFVCSYQNNIYEEFAGIYVWMGKDFTKALLSRYNDMAAERDVHLPKCSAYPLRFDYVMVQHLAAMQFFRKIHKKPQYKDCLLSLLQELYPADISQNA